MIDEALQASEAQIQELTNSLDEQGADVRRIGQYWPAPQKLIQI